MFQPYISLPCLNQISYTPLFCIVSRSFARGANLCCFDTLSWNHIYIYRGSDREILITCMYQCKQYCILLFSIYRGYGKRHTVTGLDHQTEYHYRIRFMNNYGNSEWSAHVNVSTTSKI